MILLNSIGSPWAVRWFTVPSGKTFISSKLSDNDLYLKAAGITASSNNAADVKTIKSEEKQKEQEVETVLTAVANA